jgi:uncharacterized repeat protein (TIGR01451 family)
MIVTPIGAGLIFKRSRWVTYTVELSNNGTQTATNITATVYVPDEMEYVTNTVRAVNNSAQVANHTISWNGDIAPAETVTVTALFTTSRVYLDDWLVSTITLTQNENGAAIQRWFVYDAQFFEALKTWFPIFSRQAPLLNPQLPDGLHQER